MSDLDPFIFNVSNIREIIQSKNIVNSFDSIREMLRGKGYEWLFFTRATVDPLIKLCDVFGYPHVVMHSTKPRDRWFYHPLYDLGFWAAFKTDEDAIHFKLMGLGVPEKWELPQ